MKLKQLRLYNFRCFKEETSIDFEDLIALVGKNDSGKSTILDALDIFLNDINPDKDDASKGSNPENIKIICEFVDLPDEVILDDTSPTKFSTEFLLNSKGRLEIHKSYSGNLQNPKCKSIEACAVHPSIDGAKDLLQLKNRELKKRAEELDINLDGVDQRVNAQIRARIRENFSELNPNQSMLPLNEENAKKIWTELSKYLPAFALFKSDRASTDQDPEAQDPLKAAIKEAIKSKEAELEEITEYVRSEVQKIADATLEKLHEMDPGLATQLSPTFSPPKWNTLFKASIASDDNIPINKRGSGVKRLILLNFFRAKAEQLARKTERSTIIYAIEEPETSQHPNNQRMLLRALSDLSSDAQVIISTHTPMLARALPDNSLRYINVRDSKREILVGGSKTNKIFSQSLGVLPDNTVKLFIGLEGPNDIAFMQNISKVLRKDGIDIPDLERMELEGELIFIPLGGSNLAHWSSKLCNLNRPEFYLFDRDTIPPKAPKYQKHETEINNRENCKACCTTKKEIENYIHKEAVVNAYRENGIDISIETNFNSFDDVPLIVAQKVHEVSDSPKKWDELTDKEKEEKESRAKRILCSRATNYMNAKLLKEIDPDNSLLQLFSFLKNLLFLKND